MSFVPPAPHVDALDLLTECERHWGADPPAAWRGDDGVDSGHRRLLVLHALAAYEALRATRAPHRDPLTVFRRWPVCTTVGLLAAAAQVGDRAGLVAALRNARPAPDDTDPDLELWLRGWLDCWDAVGAGREPDPTAVPGLRLLLAAARPSLVAPEVRLDVDRRALLVVLAGAERDGTVEAGGSACPEVPDGWLVLRPAPAAQHRDALGDLRRLRIVDPSDPLLLFTEDGVVLPAGEPLPAGDVWVLHLGEPPPESFQGGHRVLESAGPPLGWSRWWLGLVCLDEGAAIRSAGFAGAQRRFGPWRTTGSQGDADLDLGPPIPALQDIDGGPVHSFLPRLRVPAGADWTVEVHGAGQTTLHTVGGGGVLDLADILDRPSLGRFEIRAGSPGRRLRRTVTVAQDLQVRPDRHVRIFDNGGLMPASFVLRAPHGMHIPSTQLRLRRHEINRTVELRAGGPPLTVRLELPHCAVRARTSGANGPWSTDPQIFTLGGDADPTLDLLLPDAVRHALDGIPELVAADRDRTVVQPITGRRVTDGVYRYPLVQLVDTVRSVGTVQARLTLGEREFVVAVVRRPAVARGARLDGRLLRLVERAAHGRLTVQVHAVHAPWVPPLRVELRDGEDSVELHGPFTGGGPLVVVVAPAGIDLPPGWPRRSELPREVRLFEIGDRERVPSLDSTVDAAMAHYLAGAGPLPGSPAALPLILAVAAWAPRGLGGGIGRAVAQECASRLDLRPAATLLAAGRSRLTTTELVEPIIRSGLAAHRFAGVADPDTVTTLCATAPLAAVLLASPLLPYAAGLPDWDGAELDPSEARLLETVREAMPAAAEILTGTAGEPPPDLLGPTGRPPRRHVPDGVEHVADGLADLQRLAGASPHGNLLAAVLGRSPRTEAPLLSLGCALAARFAAQGDRPAAATERRLRQTWVRLAEHAPDLVADDLVHAEMLVSGRHRLVHPEETP